MDGASGEGFEGRLEWNAAQRIGARFACAYFGIYFLPAALGLLPLNDVVAAYTRAWYAFVPWVGANVLHLEKPITVFPAGSGDTTYNYVEVLCFAILALAITLVWSLVSRARAHPRAHGVVRILLRYTVGSALLGYGMTKVIKNQFPFPYADRLTQPIGEMSPMGLLWTFMGFSQGYNLFVGLGEAVGGALLFFRRTTTLGALLSAVVMANVVVLNFCYDVPVKLYSAHLLAASVFLALPDAGRLWNVLVALRPTTPSVPVRLARPWMERSRPVLATLFLGWTLYALTTGNLERYRSSDGKHCPLHGVYEVESFLLDDEELAATDPRRWTRFSFNSYGGCTVTGASGPLAGWRFVPAESGETVELHPFQGSADPIELETVWEDPEHLTLAGEFAGSGIVVQGKKRAFLLETRGFHWINEFPFNR